MLWAHWNRRVTRRLKIEGSHLASNSVCVSSNLLRDCSNDDVIDITHLVSYVIGRVETVSEKRRDERDGSEGWRDTCKRETRREHREGGRAVHGWDTELCESLPVAQMLRGLRSSEPEQDH